MDGDLVLFLKGELDRLNRGQENIADKIDKNHKAISQRMTEFEVIQAGDHMTIRRVRTFLMWVVGGVLGLFGWQVLK